MAVGQNLKKWTWMMDHVEVRGVVRFGDLADGTELEASDSFNLELDPNYRHLVSSMRGNNGLFTNPNEIHVEAYSQSPNRFDDPDNINRAEPFYLPDKPASQKFEVRIDKAGNKRPLRAGDHVRLFGRWIIENQHEDICWTRKWGLGTDDALKLKVGCVWAELHPFDWQNIELVDALPDKSVETLSLAAPVYEEKYQRGAVVDALQVWMVDHVFILDDRSNYHHTMSASTYIKAPPPPAGSPLGDYKVAHSEQVIINGTGLGVSQLRKIDVLNDGIRVNASVTAPPKVTALPGLGGWTQQQVADVNDPANNKSVFQARYSVWLVGRRAVFVSQSVPGSMVAGRKYKVSVTMRNADNDTWTPFGSQYYALGSQSPQDNNTWGLNRVKLAAPVPPGAQTTFSFEVTAPKTPGEHYFQWRMVHEFVEWFGDFTPGGVRASVSPPTQLQLSYGPAVCSSEPDRDRLDVFMRGTDNTLHYVWFDGQNWSGWHSLGGALTSDPAAAALRPGLIYTFVRGTDNSLWYKWLSGGVGGQSNWRSLGGVLKSRPAACSSGPDRLDVFMRGTDDAVYYMWFDGQNWSGWHSLGGQATFAPAVAALGNELWVFVRGTDNAIYFRILQSGSPANATPWQRLHVTATSAPAVCSSNPASQVVDVFVRGTDNAIWYTRFTGVGFEPWKSLGGVKTSDPGAVAVRNSAWVFAHGTDDGIWFRWLSDGNVGSSWQRMPSLAG